MRDLRTIVLTNNDADEAKRLLANMEAGRPATTNDQSEEFGGSHVWHEEDQEEWRTAIEEQQEGFYQGI